MSHPAEPNRTWARAIVGELVRSGAALACVSPGARSSPLALALAELAARGEIEAWVHFDERCAAFMGLGFARASGRPALLICTSGSAGAHYLPALMEAHHSRVPLVALTADRPPELIDCGAWQATDQTRLFDGFVRWSRMLGMPSTDPARLRYARTSACRAVLEASGGISDLPGRGPGPGPVHLNVPFREPLVAWSLDEDPDPGAGGTAGTARAGRPDGAPWVRARTGAEPSWRARDHALDALAERIAGEPRGLFLAGLSEPDPALPRALVRLAAAAGYPILAEPTSGVRYAPEVDGSVIAGYDALLRDRTCSDALGPPRLVVRFGSTFTWRHVAEYIADASGALSVTVDPYAGWDDPTHTTAWRIAAAPVAFCEALADRLEDLADGAGWRGEADRAAWAARWRAASGAAAAVREESLAAWREAPQVDGRAATAAWVCEAVLDSLPEGALLWAANSMAVRDLDTFTGPRSKAVFALASRGLAGVDGTLSTAVGAAAGWRSRTGRPAALVTGDLAFAHDLNGLAVAADERPDLLIVVLNDRGGGIFEHLPLADGRRAAFERFFAVPPGIALDKACQAYGVPHARAADPRALGAAARLALEAGGLHVVEVPVDRAANTAAHRAYWAAAAEAAASALESPAVGEGR